MLCCMIATPLERGGGKLCIINKVKINKKLRIGIYHCLLINHGEWITCTVENTDKRTNGRTR